MKKTSILSLFILYSIIPGNAQVVVKSNGKIGIGNSNPQSPISLNCSGNSNYYAYYRGPQIGITCETDSNSYCALYKLTGSCSFNCALSGNTYTTLDPKPYFGTGVLGTTSSCRYNAGVTGYASPMESGAGIVGSSTVFCLWNGIDKAYAGYFYGDVKISNNLIVNGSITGTYLGASATQSRARSSKTLDVTDLTTTKLSKLNTTAYQIAQSRKSNMEQDYKKTLLDTLYFKCKIPNDVEELSNPIEEQSLEKVHYGFDAEQLEKVYPELVYQQEDGSKSINYIEMIPLLVQTINELNSRITQLEGQNRNEKMVSAANTVNESTSVKAPSITKVGLYQNTPNPFTERTTISFTLPDDAKNAYIYIFDMQGKLMKQLPINPSIQSVTINGYELQAGLYLYSLVTDGQEIATKKMILSK